MTPDEKTALSRDLAELRVRLAQVETDRDREARKVDRYYSALSAIAGAASQAATSAKGVAVYDLANIEKIAREAIG